MAKSKKTKTSSPVSTMAVTCGQAVSSKGGIASRASPKQNKNKGERLTGTSQPAASKPVVSKSAVPKPAASKMQKNSDRVEVKFDKPFHSDNHGHDVLRLRKTIVLLSMLTETPEYTVPTTPRISNASGSSPSSKYLLSFDEEKALVDVFTFVSSTTTDPHKVGAFCLEQRSSATGHSFCLNIAANHGNSVTLKAGLESLITSLSSVHVDATKQPALVLREIALLNHNRILCRIQSRHAKWTGTNFSKAKKSRPPLLPRMIETYRQHAVKDTSLAPVAVQINDIEHMSNTIEASPPILPCKLTNDLVNLLVNLLESINRLWRHACFRQKFETCQWSRTLAKLARYVSASTFLVSQFSTHAALRSLKVAVVKLEPWSVPKHTPNPGDLNLFVTELIPANVNRNLLQHLRPSDSTVMQKLRTNPDATFEEIVSTACPVHAEIQLLFHYELHPVDVPPRAILSTKKPCFLCGLVFQLHGRYYVPKSHGRLYEKWTLPQVIKNLPDKRAVTIPSLVTNLLDILAEAVNNAVASPKKPGRMSLESLFLQSAIWARIRSGRSSLHPSRVITRQQSKASELRTTNRSLSAASSQETIKLSDGSSSLLVSQEKVLQSVSPASSASALGDVASQSTSQDTILYKPCSLTSSSSTTKTVVTSLNLSTSMITSIPSQNCQPYRVRTGSSAILNLDCNIRGRVDAAVRTKLLDISFSTSYLDNQKSETQKHDSRRIDHSYVVIRNLTQMGSEIISDAVTALDISDLKPGQDLVVDQKGQGGGSMGFILKAQDEVIFVRCEKGLT